MPNAMDPPFFMTIFLPSVGVYVFKRRTWNTFLSIGRWLWSNHVASFDLTMRSHSSHDMIVTNRTPLFKRHVFGSGTSSVFLLKFDLMTNIGPLRSVLQCCLIHRGRVLKLKKKNFCKKKWSGHCPLDNSPHFSYLSSSWRFKVNTSYENVRNTYQIYIIGLQHNTHLMIRPRYYCPVK